jgi:hypothetical protein
MLASFIITYTLLIVVALVASNWELFDDLSNHDSLRVYLALFISLGGFLSKVIAVDIWKTKNVELSAILSGCYYLYAFCVFGNGHFAGWSVSAGFFERFWVSILTLGMFLVTLVFPVIFYFIARAQCLLLKKLYRI